jgi:hypothetical protein
MAISSLTRQSQDSTFNAAPQSSALTPIVVKPDFAAGHQCGALNGVASMRKAGLGCSRE